MAISTLIPERTIDAWTSSALTDRVPRALIWAPTPPAQAPSQAQPWDFAVELATKLLIIENKALLNTSAAAVATRVEIGFVQLVLLCLREKFDDLPIFYGLPGLLPADLQLPIPPEPFVQRAGWRLTPPFGDWQKMVRPVELLGIPQVLTAFLKGQQSVTIDNALLQPFRSFTDLIEDVLQCVEGRRLPPDPRSPDWPRLRPISDRYLETLTDRLRREVLSPSALPDRLDDILSEPEFAEADQVGADSSSRRHMGRLLWYGIPVTG